MVIKAIVFDCFGVLASSARAVLRNNYPKFKTQIDDICHQYDYGLISRQQFDDSLAELFGITPEQIKSRYWGKIIRDEKTIKWVSELKSSGKYKVGMLSNVGYNFLNSLISPSEQAELFDEVVLSSDEGLAKPEIAIFELIAKRLGVKTDECVMIDDTALNIEAAKNSGMQGIWFISTDQAKYELNQLLG